MKWIEVPLKVKIFVVLVALIALPMLLWAGKEVLSDQTDHAWIALAFLALLTFPFFLRFPSQNSTMTIGDALVMVIAMMYGIAPCIIANFIYILFVSIRAPWPKVHPYRVVFNTASTTCGALIYSWIFQKLSHGNTTLPGMLLPAVALVVAYFLINSTLTSIAIAWSQGESVIKYWTQTCIPMVIDYSLSSATAVCIVVTIHISEYMPLIAAPVSIAVWGWYRLNNARVMEAEKHLKELEQLYLRTVESLALAVDAKDQTTYGHIRRVKVYATGLAKLCGIKDANELKAVETGSLLHDIGKLAIDDYILNKPGKLTKEEFEKIKIHAVAGDEILRHVHFPFPAALYVRHHHERWDGNGYPDGLKGEEIPVGARILAIADAFDAIRFSRPYKLAIPIEEARDLLRAQAGTIYDPHLIKIFVEHMYDLERQAVRESENLPEPSFRKYFESANRALSAADVAAPGPIQVTDVPAELVLLSEFCSTVAGHLDMKDIFPIVAARLKKIVPFSTCAIYLNEGNELLRALYVNGEFAELIQDTTIGIGKGISGWVAAYKRPMFNTGPGLDFQNISGDFPSYKDTLVVPIVHEEESIGTISLYAQQSSAYSQHELNVLQALSGFLAPLIAVSVKKEAKASEEILDPTTGLHRIPYLTAIGPQLIAAAGKNRTPASLIFIEIRNLTQIIRTYGASTGNSVLKAIADCIKPELRGTDVLVRFGHHGFVAFLPGVRDEQALHCAQRLKHQIKGSASAAAGQHFTLDCQTGIASYPRNGITIFALLQSAQEQASSREEPVNTQDSNVIGFTPRT